jgi:hypothetical protein
MDIQWRKDGKGRKDRKDRKREDETVDLLALPALPALPCKMPTAGWPSRTEDRDQHGESEQRQL